MLIVMNGIFKKKCCDQITMNLITLMYIYTMKHENIVGHNILHKYNIWK